MKIQKINTGIIITKTAKQPSAKIEFSLDELDALSEFCERLQDEKDIREYLNTAVTIPDSAEVSAPIAVKYLHDAALFEQLVDETRRNQEENQSNFLTAVSDAVSSIEKSRDVKEWHGLTKETAERFAREFMAERNPGRWSGFGEVPESVSLDPLNFPINDIYPKGNKPALRMQLISVTYYLCLTKQTNPFWSMTPAATTSSSMQLCSSRAPLTISGPRHPFIFCSNKKNLSTAYPYVKLAIRTMTSMVRSSCSRARLMTR